MLLTSVFFVRDIDAQPVPPVWPPDPASLLIDDFVYEVACVPLSSIALVTNKIVKVGSPIDRTYSCINGAIFPARRE